MWGFEAGFPDLAWRAGSCHCCAAGYPACQARHREVARDRVLTPQPFSTYFPSWAAPNEGRGEGTSGRSCCLRCFRACCVHSLARI